MGHLRPKRKPTNIGWYPNRSCSPLITHINLLMQMSKYSLYSTSRWRRALAIRALIIQRHLFSAVTLPRFGSKFRLKFYLPFKSSPELLFMQQQKEGISCSAFCCSDSNPVTILWRDNYQLQAQCFFSSYCTQRPRPYYVMHEWCRHLDWKLSVEERGRKGARVARKVASIAELVQRGRKGGENCIYVFIVFTC